MPFRSSLAAVAVLLLLIVRASAATHPSAEPFTPKERAQGYSDRAILAKPRADRLARAEAEESAEHVQVREAFPRLEGVRIIELEAGESVDAAIARLQATGRYEFVEPDHLMYPDVAPNDPTYPSQWSLNNTGQLAGSTVGVDIKAQAAWDIIREAPNVIVAQIDNGVRVDHEDLAPNLWRNPAPTFGDVNGASILRGVRSGDIGDQSGHGSHVAGIITASGNNGVATTGVAWRVQLMPLKNSGADGTSSTSDSAALVNYAIAHGAQIINCSFGGTSYSQTFYTALRAARDAGIIVVCSAGNNGTSNDTTPHYPSNYLLDNIVAVGNSGPTDSVSSSSNYGAAVDLFAPGSSIWSTDYATTNGAVSKSGTSMATPHVTGSLALLRAQFPNDTYRQLINRLLRGAEIKTSLAGRAVTNARLNLLRALTTTTNRPANDDFATRYIITGSTLSLRANNRGATVEAGEPNHGDLAPAATLWWQWAASTTGTIVVDTTGSDYDTTLAVYSGATTATFASLTPVAANDDNGSERTSRVAFNVTQGNSYFFAIGGKGGGEGYTQLNLSLAPANDNFANATTLSGASAQGTARNNSATLEAGEPRILGFEGGGSVWYKWTAPRSGRFQVSAFSQDFDTVLAIYTGSSLNTLNLVLSGDNTDSGPGLTNADSRCDLNATAGTTYYFQADTKAGNARGTIVVSVTDSLWQFSTDGGAITSAPAIGADGTIYAGAVSPDRRLYALTPDGALKWTYTAGGTIDVSAVAIGNDGTLYLGTGDGKFTALTAAGTVRWQRDLGTGNGVSVSPALAADGTLYTHALDGYLYALSGANGATKWRYNVNARNTFASAAIAPDGTIYQGSDDGALYALNPDGSLKWRYAAPNDSYSTPALDAAGNIYYATYTTPRVVSLAPDGTQRWIYSGITSASSSSPVLSADGTTVYIGGGDRRVHAIDASTGAARWEFQVGSSILASVPAVDADGVVYIGCYDGKLYAVTPGGALKRTWDTGQPIRSSPAIFGTTLYVGSGDAKLYAFDIGASAAGGPWPQYRQNVRRLGRAVVEPLAITAAPQSQNVNPEQPLRLSVSATGQGPLTYQWRKDGTPIAGATGSSYTIASATAAAAGSYTVAITGTQGTVTSTAANVVVNVIAPADVGRLVNLSILTSIANNGDSFTLGYVVGGSGTSGAKPLVIRAAGPALAALNVAGPLDDPKIELFAGSTKTGENDNWGGAPTLSAAMAAVGAFSYSSTTSRDAAIATNIATSDNSVKVSAAGSSTGAVIAEVYDATPSNSFTATTPRLVNVSVLKHLGSGLTAGFVIGGVTSKTVLIRAIGPSLGTLFNVAGAVADSRLELFSGPTRIGLNDDWGGTPELSAAFAKVAAFSLAPTSRDAAVVTKLAPGNYTVQVSGSNNITGIVLVEIYEVP
jgi:outer membrane protein assembly factor BamB/subtilisin family serine protease